MKRFLRWLFAPPSGNSAWQLLVWWETRRIPFNILIGTHGVVCLLVFFWAIETSGQLQPGEDAVEPIALLFAPIAINLLYTLGWIVEISVRRSVPDLSSKFGPLLLKLGLGLGFFLITLPAAFWGSYRVLQIAGLIA